MSRYFLHAPFAEDQPLAKTILTTHVLTRAVTTGTIIGGGVFGVQTLLLRRGKAQPSASSDLTRPQLFLRTAGLSTAYTLGVVSMALVARMWGREDIEWQDRSWRLMENKGQLETDDWTYAGAAGGLLAGPALSKATSPAVASRGAGWIGVVGSVGVGSVLGMLGYLGWRHGIHGGKFPEDEKVTV